MKARAKMNDARPVKPSSSGKKPYSKLKPPSFRAPGALRSRPPASVLRRLAAPAPQPIDEDSDEIDFLS